MNDTAIAKRETANWTPANFSQARELSEMVAQSGFAPEDYRGKPQDCLMAMMAGNEVGLGPMASLQNIAVINGRPSIWGDAALALVKSSADFEWIKEWIDDESQTAYCKVKRRGEDPVVRSFSWEDAKRAGLAGKKGPWQTYPKRMMQMRARSWAIRDVWPHVLKGLSIAEEASDVPKKERDVSPTNTAPAAESPAESEEKEQPIDSEADVARKELVELLNYALSEKLVEQGDYDTVLQKADGYKKQYPLNADKVIRRYTEQIRDHIEDLKNQRDEAVGEQEEEPAKETEENGEDEPEKDGQEDLDIF